jgi:hypothetical protein
VKWLGVRGGKSANDPSFRETTLISLARIGLFCGDCAGVR